MASIYVLQIGKEDFSKSYFLPDYVKYTYLDMFTSLPRSSYDVVLIDRKISMQEAELLLEVTRAYTLFVTERVELSGRLAVCTVGRTDDFHGTASGVFVGGTG